MKKTRKLETAPVQNFFLRYMPTIITMLTLLFGLYQYFDSQLRSDIRRFNQAYFDERLTLYKNLSSSVSEVMVDMQMRNKEAFKMSYKKFKTHYWSIQLVKDSTYDSLLASIHEFDGLVSGFHDIHSESEMKNRYTAATSVVQIINDQLNKLILNELININDSDRLGVLH